ncbi:MAG: TatD family hydrolase [Deltaproteobacteria bacterium]|nr:TatD family hydrolase [Deltaproteobacteria bacterium]
MAYYVDVHTHLTHPEFQDDTQAVIERAEKKGLRAIVVNGLEPQSNRQILKLSKQYPIVKAALGIYPIEAVNEILPPDFKLPLQRFSVRQEIDFIADLARAGELIAIGECGMDGYHLDPHTFPRQEEVFIALLSIAQKNDIPVIVHSRKCETRILEILAHYKVRKANLHCYTGKIKAAVQASETYGWCFSIPANIARVQSFQLLAAKLPEESLLTETDAPYLSPQPGTRNEPAHVCQTIEQIAGLRGWQPDEAKEKVWKNYERLFMGKSASPP